MDALLENKENFVSSTWGLAIAISDIEEADVVDAEPVRHGRWLHLGGDEWNCSKCGEVIYTEGSWEIPNKKYCHECGAKMDLEELK